MVDWFSWVMIGLMVYFFGKAQYFKSEVDNYYKHDLDYGEDGYYTQEIDDKKNENMSKFYIILVVFLVTETYHLWT
tara:strand:+ start:557 stop:784 length:228 start_codon:yes stop_codon:yes gene_type:complete